MRKAVRGAVLAAVLAAAAFDIGAYARGDYRGEEPVRDMMAGLGALAVIAAAGWASAEPNREKAEVDR